MNVPSLPLYTGEQEKDLELVKSYISDLHSYLLGVDTELRGFGTTGVTPDMTLVVGDSLVNTQHFLGTLVEALKVKVSKV
jgi:hypothetical protein